MLITFHEFGHFGVARRCGVKVLHFSVGFGKAIWTRIDRDGTEYEIALIPLGGYVKMLDEREGDVDPALAGQDYNRQAGVAAHGDRRRPGPRFNLIFTVVAFWLMFMLGKPDWPPSSRRHPTASRLRPGFDAGDRIVSVDGKPVATWTELWTPWRTACSMRPVAAPVRGADGAQRQLVLRLTSFPGEDIDKSLDELGLKLRAAAARRRHGSLRQAGRGRGPRRAAIGS